MPRARNAARTSVVFPAPRSPESVTIIPPLSADASASPACAVSVSSASAKRASTSRAEPSRRVTLSLMPITPHAQADAERDWGALARDIAAWGRDLGFQAIGIAGVDLAAEEMRLMNWLAAGRHGEMDYM